MLKPWTHLDLSDVECYEKECHTRIKKNVIARMPKGTPLRCYKCGYRRRMQQRGIQVVTPR